MSLLIEQVSAPTEEVRGLIAELDAELNAEYPAENRHGLNLARIFQPNVSFILARLNGEAVGCGGIAFANGMAELKRMYVRPSARGKGIAAAILNHLEQQARHRNITRLVLETGDGQKAALRFYQREGFTRCEAFEPYASMPPSAIQRSVFFQKRIASVPSSPRK